MTSPEVTQTPSNAQLPNRASGGVTLTPTPGANILHANSFRVAAVIDRLSLHVGNKVNLENENFEFINLCLSLSRGLDFAIANHQQVDRRQELPSLVKQVCQIKKNNLVLAANMILMISIKSACDSGWFSGEDSEELKNLAEEIAKKFGTVPTLEADLSCPHSVISTVMARFYPMMKLGDVLVCFEAKSGFDSYVKDFQISKKEIPPEGQVRLFVMQIDTIETSSCLISPPKVNFLLNGKGVKGRSGLFVDTLPQLPTVVSRSLKYGSNILQAVGEFKGNYIVAVAYASETQNLDSSILQEYERHAPMSMEADSELVEGPSRISLNCPFSFERINIPVKGQSCKHTQCFDFNNYVDINSKRPTWLCPHCNQHVCFTDIRIDPKMVQVLREGEEKITEVIISSDWSWKPVMKSGEAPQKPEDKISNDGDGKSPKSPDGLLDLTQTDDAIDVDEDEDRKHLRTTVLAQSTTQALTIGQPRSPQNAAATTLASQNEISSSVDPLLVQPGNSTVAAENGRFSHISRVPNAIQALPAQTRTPVRKQAVASRPSSMPSTRPSQLGIYPSSNTKIPQVYGVPIEHPHAHGIDQTTSHPPYNTVPSPQERKVRPRGIVSTATHADPIAAANRIMHAGPSPRPNPAYQTNTNAHIPDIPNVDNPNIGISPQYWDFDAYARGNVGISPQPSWTVNDLSTEQNWRPTVRMRGALSGQAYLDAFDKLITRPSHQAQAVRPVSNVVDTSADRAAELSQR